MRCDSYDSLLVFAKQTQGQRCSTMMWLVPEVLGCVEGGDYLGVEGGYLGG